MSGFGTFALGVGAALIARSIGPALGRKARPAVRGAIKQAIIVGQGAQVRTAQVREDLEDLVAEAREEVRSSQQPRPATASQVVP